MCITDWEIRACIPSPSMLRSRLILSTDTLEALHYAYVVSASLSSIANHTCSAAKGSTDVLEHILSHEDCDVDPINRLEGATPLHLAIRLDDPDLRKHVVESLLDAGADTTYGIHHHANTVSH